MNVYGVVEMRLKSHERISDQRKISRVFFAVFAEVDELEMTPDDLWTRRLPEKGHKTVLKKQQPSSSQFLILINANTNRSSPNAVHRCRTAAGNCSTRCPRSWCKGSGPREPLSSKSTAWSWKPSWESWCKTPVEADLHFKLVTVDPA